MNLRALYTVYDNEPEAIRQLATRHGLDPVVAIGVVKLLIANDGNLASLSPKQKQHFEQAIKPLIE